MIITNIERGVLQILAKSGGRHTFRPDAPDNVAYTTFVREVVRILYSLQAKGLVGIDEGASRLFNMPGQQSKFVSIVAEITRAGRESVQ
jgi:hypothetical protein